MAWPYPRCRRCPYMLGCFPVCKFPSATWADNNSNSEAPQWVNDWNDYMDRVARKEAGDV